MTGKEIVEAWRKDTGTMHADAQEDAWLAARIDTALREARAEALEAARAESERRGELLREAQGYLPLSAEALSHRIDAALSPAGEGAGGASGAIGYVALPRVLAWTIYNHLQGVDAKDPLYLASDLLARITDGREVGFVSAPAPAAEAGGCPHPHYDPPLERCPKHMDTVDKWGVHGCPACLEARLAMYESQRAPDRTQWPAWGPVEPDPAPAPSPAAGAGKTVPMEVTETPCIDRLGHMWPAGELTCIRCGLVRARDPGGARCVKCGKTLPPGPQHVDGLCGTCFLRGAR
jgi:hypothetical protein